MKTFIVLAALSTLSIFTETTKIVSYPSKDEALSDKNMDGRIINGYLNKPGEIPYIVSLKTSPPAHICGGSIIAQEWILTAANCLKDKTHVLISYGTIKWKKPLIEHKVGKENFFIHKGFSQADDEKSLINDIALIRTPPVDFSNWINKINLPISMQENINDQWALASGWGYIRPSQHYPFHSNLLQSMDVQVVSNRDCTRQFPMFQLSETHICTSVFETKSICLGDFGGPLVLNANELPYKTPILIGIASFVDDLHCVPGYPNLYTRVSKFLPWIATTLETESTLDV